MTGPAATLLDRLEARAADWVRSTLERVDADPGKAVAEALPQLARRIGRRPLSGGLLRSGDVVVDLDAWRLCDAAGFALLERAGEAADLEDLYAHGDLEERAIVLRALSFLPVDGRTIRLLGEAQRTSVVTHFEAAVCDSNLAARALEHPAFALEDFNRLILKAAFLDLPLRRLFGVEEHANEELSRMLLGLATEREAAGRTVWTDTDRMIARAPIPGGVARIVGHLEHGDDATRLAAAEAVALLRRPELAPFVAERLAREPVEEIRMLLRRALPG